MGSLVAAYSIAWVILMGYLLTLATRQRRLERQLAQLQEKSESLPAGRHAG